MSKRKWRLHDHPARYLSPVGTRAPAQGTDGAGSGAGSGAGTEAGMSAEGIINSLGISLVLWALLFILVAWARAEELPQAPSMTLRQPVETYEPDQRMIVHNYPDRAI